MKIFYDHQIFSLQNFGGASRLFAELAININQHSVHQAHISAFLSNNAYLREKDYKLPVDAQTFKVFGKRGLLGPINDLYTTLDMNLRRFDIYHATYYSTKFLKFAKEKPVVVTFLDMIHERFHDKFPEIAADKKVIKQKEEIARMATHIISISESTKKDMVEIYGIDPAKISVAHLGSSFDSSLAEKDANPVHPYLLYVGTRDAYKNFKLMLRSIAGTLLNNDIRLICAGGKNFSAEETALIESLKLTSLVEHDSINDKKLATLYTNALAFIMPSLYEGFGIPVLEAFSCDCPCIISNTSSLPEVGGDAAVYIDPYSEDSIKHSVESVISSVALRNEMIIKGRERLKDFSWEKMATETIKVYETLL